MTEQSKQQHGSPALPVKLLEQQSIQLDLTTLPMLLEMREVEA